MAEKGILYTVSYAVLTSFLTISVSWEDYVDWLPEEAYVDEVS